MKQGPRRPVTRRASNLRVPGSPAGAAGRPWPARAHADSPSPEQRATSPDESYLHPLRGRRIAKRVEGPRSEPAVRVYVPSAGGAMSSQWPRHSRKCRPPRRSAPARAPRGRPKLQAPNSKLQTAQEKQPWHAECCRLRSSRPVPVPSQSSNGTAHMATAESSRALSGSGGASYLGTAGLSAYACS